MKRTRVNLPDVPRELHEIIVSSLDDKSRRYLRVASTYWFNLINYNEFTIYFARSTTLPEMVDRFAKYEGPIALRFKKEIRMDANRMAKYLQRLTNITGLSMSQNVKPLVDDHPSFVFTNQKFSLSTLTNLQEWYDMPCFGKDHFEMLLNFSRLTKLRLQGENWHKATLEQIIINNSNLEVLDLDYNMNINDLISILPNPSPLTSLSIPPSSFNFKEEHYSKLGNLRHLRMHGGFYRTFTALESLEADYCVVSFDVNTTLTRLILTSSSNEILKTSLPNLVNLHEFVKLGRGFGGSIDVPLYLQPDKLTKLHIMQEEGNKIEHMSRLTKLENLLISRATSETDQETLEPIMNLTKLTQLRLHCDFKTDNSPYMTNLTNLKSLILRRDLTNLMTADAASKFSKLEELRFCEYFADEAFLTRIQALHQPTCYHTILSNFKNLTRLQIHNQTPDLWQTLTKLSNLKALTIGWMDAKDIPALTKLTALTDLDIGQFVMTDREIFAKLTNLQRLWLTYNDKRETHYFYSKLPYLHSFGWKRNQLL